MEFFNSAIEVLQTLVVALGAGLGVWGAINLLEGYGNDNPGSKGHRQYRRPPHEADSGNLQRLQPFFEPSCQALIFSAFIGILLSLHKPLQGCGGLCYIL